METILPGVSTNAMPAALPIHMDSNMMWAGLLWGGVGGGYLVYGWRQKSGYPLAGGVVMTLACFLNALPMTITCLVTMFAVYWLMKNAD
jgi:hypothetical protein